MKIMQIGKILGPRPIPSDNTQASYYLPYAVAALLIKTMSWVCDCECYYSDGGRPLAVDR